VTPLLPDRDMKDENEPTQRPRPVSISIFAIFLLHSPHLVRQPIFKAPDSSFPRQALGFCGAQEMWALVGADWPHGAEIMQPGNYTSASCSAASLNSNLFNNRSHPGVLTTSKLRNHQSFPSHNSCPHLMIQLATHYSKVSVVESLSPSDILLHTKVCHCL
jgi:hypothetical protein